MAESNVSNSSRPWIMNAFVMSAPGHLAPGKLNLRPLHLHGTHTLKVSGDILTRVNSPWITG